MTATTSTRFRAPPKALFSSHFARQRTTVYPDTLGATRAGPSAAVTANSGPATLSVRTLAWSPLGNLLATGSGTTLRVWNPEKPNIRHSTEMVRAHGQGIERVAWNPAREAELASCSPDGMVRFWDVRSKGSIGEVKVGGECFTLAWKPDGEEVVVGRKDDTLIRIDRGKLAQVDSYRQPVQTNQTAFSWSGKELFLTTGDGSVKVLDYPSMNHLYTINAHTSSCYAIEMNAPATHLAVGGSDALITLWDTTNWVCQRTLDHMTGPVRSISFSCDGAYIVGGSDEGSGIEIVHAESGDYVHRVDFALPAPVVQWSPKDYSLAYAFGEGHAGLRIIGSFGLS
ncbi:WD40 repeat-containing protein [Trichodelitschia bisporula]|uniref:WD40 repeat-containing protein n=1 Tax=Trichodelitschia bisporula TaxID=703511 RepID=A0A6G1HZ15_9PEZI|nr:WD40 repeat-containing protein [Trichodelitschia bisporula]